MPIIIPKELPSYKILKKENVFVVTRQRAQTQDFRELKIVIVNLMPNKIETETQLIRMLSNTPIQMDLKLLTMDSHKSKNVSDAHLKAFYITLDQIKKEKFDGMIITGAPVETLPFTKVDYYDELKKIMDFSKKNVYSTLHLCWGAQAGLSHHFGIKKTILKEKCFGVFEHKLHNQTHLLTLGLDKHIQVPHSRWTGLDEEAIKKTKELHVLIDSTEKIGGREPNAQVGTHLVHAYSGRQIFSQGHWEYDIDTLKNEYLRDTYLFIKNVLKQKSPMPRHEEKWLLNHPVCHNPMEDQTKLPKHYFENDIPRNKIIANWKANGNLFFLNWINFVYQMTPFDLGKLEPIKE